MLVCHHLFILMHTLYSVRGFFKEGLYKEFFSIYAKCVFDELIGQFPFGELFIEKNWQEAAIESFMGCEKTAGTVMHSNYHDQPGFNIDDMMIEQTRCVPKE